MTFTIVQGDTAPPISSRLTDSGEPIDLSTASNIYFRMEDKFDRVIISRQLTGSDGRVSIVDESTAEVEYVWRSGDTDRVGSYKAEWEVLYDDGKTETFPSDGKVHIEITEAIE